MGPGDRRSLQIFAVMVKPYNSIVGAMRCTIACQMRRCRSWQQMDDEAKTSVRSAVVFLSRSARIPHIQP